MKTLSDVTYGDVTDNGTKSGVVILSKFTNQNEYFWSYEASIRSAWADSDNFDEVLSFLRNEKSLIDSGTALTGNQVENASNQVDSRQGFRVMQGVVTMDMSVGGIVRGITSWSLVNRAKTFNSYLISQDDFQDLLSSMPIIMVDYADTNHNNFLDSVMEIIIEQNS